MIKLFGRLTESILNICGWRVEGRLPEIDKYIIVGAPHTSNWDFVLMVAVCLVYRQKFFWMGKSEMFVSPFDRIFRIIGGIPINRGSSSNTVKQIIKAFQERDRMVMVITPEGTRKRVDYWKTGFYYIATGAGIPIMLGFIDYRRKVIGVGNIIFPSGDIEADMEIIRNFYMNISAKHPDQAGEIRVKIKVDKREGRED